MGVENLHALGGKPPGQGQVGAKVAVAPHRQEHLLREGPLGPQELLLPVPQVDDHLRLGLGQNGPAQAAVVAVGVGHH